MLPHRYAAVLTLAATALGAQYAGAQQKSSARLDSTILALERRGWEAVKRKDARAVFDLGGGSFVYVQPTGMQRMSMATAPNAFAECETRSYGIDSATVTRVGANGAVLTYRLTLDQTCGGEKVPSPWYVTEVWEQRKGQWVIVTRSDTQIQQTGSR
jgi:ketosteroid isomerase-like protein